VLSAAAHHIDKQGLVGTHARAFAFLIPDCRMDEVKE
jgi:hypothetical protein